jgi:cell division protein FtsB
MSAWMAQTGTRLTRLPRLAEHAVERARLTVVPRRTRAPRMPFTILVALVLLGGVVGLLMFNTSMQQASFRVTALEARAAALHAQEQSLRMELDGLRDPQLVAQRAQQLGMVPLVDPAFIRLSDGAELGNPAPASADTRQRIDPLPAPRPVSVPADDVAVAPSEVPDTTLDGVPSDETGPGTGTTGGQG